MYLGQEVCVREFVPQLPTLASDTMFHVRKVGQYNSVYSWIFSFVCFFSLQSFAICCKDLCSVIGQTSTEDIIVSWKNMDIYMYMYLYM